MAVQDQSFRVGRLQTNTHVARMHMELADPKAGAVNADRDLGRGAARRGTRWEERDRDGGQHRKPSKPGHGPERRTNGGKSPARPFIGLREDS